MEDEFIDEGSASRSAERENSGSAQQSVAFYVDWNHPSICCVGRDGRKSSSKSDFAIKLDMMIEANRNTGYLATVKRAIDGEQRSCFFTVESTSFKARFMTQINNSFGSGGMSLALNEAQFQHFVQFLKEDVSTIPIREAITHIGLNSKYSVWVLGENLQINTHGEIIPEGERKLIWHDSSVVENLRSTKVQVDEVIPKIIAPLQTSALNRMVELLQIAMKHNFYSALLVVSGVILTFHYDTLSVSSFGCPVIVAYGPTQTGKSKTLMTGLGIIGLGRLSIYESFTNAYVMERASVSTMPFAIDDPSNQPSKGSNINEVIVDIYNHGKTGTLRKGSVVPISAPVIATNYELNNDDRVRSRVCNVPFKNPTVAPSDDKEQEAYDELDDMIKDGLLSSACGWAIRIGETLHSRDIVREMTRHFRPYFPGRNAINWTLLGVCVKELLMEANRDDLTEDIMEFMKSLGEPSKEQPLTADDITIINATLNDVLSYIVDKDLSENLCFIRDDLTVASRPVLSVVLSDIAASLTYSLVDIRKALRSGGFGMKNVSKDFLEPGSTDTKVKRTENGRKRKLFQLSNEDVLSNGKEEITEELKRSKQVNNGERGSK